MRVLFLDIDGVLNRTGYRPAESVGLRSWIEPELAARLDAVLRASGASVVISSDWRVGRTIDELAGELAAAGVHADVRGTTPVLGPPRWREIQAWLEAEAVDPGVIAIVDDGHDMGPLGHRFVRTTALAGLDAAAAAALVALLSAP